MSLNLANVIGHRGACGYAPENTFVSMLIAHQLGIQWVEFDVMLTKDHEAIVIHDFTLERTTNGKGNVANTDFSAICQLDCGSWFAEHFQDEKIPSLKKLLAYLSQLNLSINVEIKPTPGTEQITTQSILALLQSYWPSSRSVPLISSFNRAVLETAFGSSAPCYLGYNIEVFASDWPEVIADCSCCSLHVDHKILTPQRVKQIKNKCEYLLAFTVNDEARAIELFQWGVDSVFSDYPDKIIDALKLPKIAL